MSSHRVVQSLSVLGIAIVLGLAGPTGASMAAAADASVAADVRLSAAKPTPIPAAKSWVGGKELIGTKVLTDLAAGVPAPPLPTATAWLVADLDTRQILAGQRVHVPLAPASTLKIFTALALAHRLDPKTVYTGRNDDAAVDGTKVGVVAGSTYTVDDLLHGMLMSSGNDCANAIGNLVGGKAKAVDLIQAEAKAIGAFDTVVRTTNGLDAAGQVSSAYDLALAGSAAVKEAQLEKIMTTKIYNFPGVGTTLGAKRARFQIQTHDLLLTSYPGATGVKNGYTVAAQGSYVGSATRNGHSYLAVVLRTAGSTPKQTAALLDWAFAHAAKAKPIGTLVQPGELTAMIGPGLPDAKASSTPAEADNAAAKTGTASGLRSSQTSLTSSLASGRSGQLLMVLAGLLALTAVVFVVSRRQGLSFAGRSTRSFSSQPVPRSSSPAAYYPPHYSPPRAPPRAPALAPARAVVMPGGVLPAGDQPEQRDGRYRDDEDERTWVPGNGRHRS